MTARVHALPAGRDGAEALAEGLLARWGGGPPEALARVEIWLGTRRMARRLAEALAPPGGPPRLMPRMRLVAEIGRDPTLLPGTPPTIPELKRTLLLTRLVRALGAGLGRRGARRRPKGGREGAGEKRGAGE
ncbi:MAG: hypothetical protein AAFW69_00190, partial [Pseudomonadota bacterium]